MPARRSSKRGPKSCGGCAKRWLGRWRPGLCEPVERPNATVDEVLNVFQDPRYRDRVALFHFGGHAGGAELLLESAAGAATVTHAGGLARFLGEQRGLELVFLVKWISDTLFILFNEASPFIASAITDPVTPGWLFVGREHVFRSQNWGRAVGLTKAKHRQHCSIWFGDGDIDEDGTYEPLTDLCDDFKALGNPAAAGRLTNAVYGDRSGGHISVVERAYSYTSTLWATTSTGRVFISKNVDNADPTTVTFTRLDSLVTNDPLRYPTAILVDRANPNHAWISYSGYTAKTPATPGHIFEVTYDPGAGTAAFTILDSLDPAKNYPAIPANAIIVTNAGTIYVGNSFGVVVKKGGSDKWKPAPAGLPNVNVADLVYVPEKDALYAGTHGQGIWMLKVK